MSKELYAQSSLHRMVRYDARSEILSSLGDLSGINLWGNQVIIAPYVQSGILWDQKLGFPWDEQLSVDALDDLYKSGKGFITPNSSKESIYQGKVALIVKIGNAIPARLRSLSAQVVKALSGVAQAKKDLDCLRRLGNEPLELAMERLTDAQTELDLLHEQEESNRTNIGQWVFTLQENTRGVSLRGPGWKKSRVLEALGIKYDGWPCRFVYESDIYGDVRDPDMLV